MDVFTTELFGTLLNFEASRCLSIYMPTHRYGREVQQGPVRLKNLLREAERRLEANAVKAAEAAELLAPVRQLLYDEAFWTQQSDGLALFLAPGSWRRYRLPVGFEEKVVFGDRFHVKPLIPLLLTGRRFFLLALSLNQVRLYEGTGHALAPVDVEGLPVSLEQALGIDQYDSGLQGHTSASSGFGHQPPIIHGHGDADEERIKTDILHFFQQVARKVDVVLKTKTVPLVLAAVGRHFPIYKQASQYPRLLDEVVAGNPEALSEHDLHSKAWELVEPALLEDQQRDVARFIELRAGHRSTTELSEIVSASHHGRVEVLFIANGTEAWGRFDPQTNVVEVHPERKLGDADLLDAAIFRTLSTRGVVHLVDPQRVPQMDIAAAILRY